MNLEADGTWDLEWGVQLRSAERGCGGVCVVVGGCKAPPPAPTLHGCGCGYSGAEMDLQVVLVCLHCLAIRLGLAVELQPDM